MERLHLEVCEDCGKTYQATPHTHYCEACRRKRQSKNAKMRNLNQLGSQAHVERARERKARIAQLVEDANAEGNNIQK